MSARAKNVLLTVAKLAITLAVLAYFFRTIDGAKLLGLARTAHLPTLALVAVLSLGRMAFAAARFQQVLAPHSAQPLGLLLRHCFIGTFFNQLMPTAIGGDAVRVVLLRRDAGVAHTEGAVLVFVERLLALVALGAICLFAAPLAALPSEVAWLPWLTGASVLGGAVVLFAIGRAAATDRLPSELLRRAANAFALLPRHPRSLVAAMALSLAFQAVGIVETFLVAQSLGIPLPLVTALALVPVVYIATVLPISFGGVGVRELAFVTLFLPLGIADEASLAISLGTFASLALPGIVGGVLWLVRSGPHAPTEELVAKGGEAAP